MRNKSKISAILYGKVGKDFFRQHRDRINNLNYSAVKLFSCVGILTFLVAIFFGGQLSEFHKMKYVYLSGLCVSLIALAVVLMVLKTRPKLISPAFYTLIALYYVIGILLSVALNPNSPTTMFFIQLIIFPLMYVDKPINSYIITTVADIVFLIITVDIKSGEALQTDIINSVICWLLCMFAILRVRNLYLSSIQLSLIYQAKSETDKLTGISNKDSTENLCIAYLNNIGYNVNCALLIIDVDDFKHINDTFGHKQGDAVLKAVGEQLRDIFRENDVVGRIGGDEFLVLMKDINNPLIAEIKATEILRRVGTIMSDVTSKKLTCSIGISSCISNDMGYTTMFTQADKALYNAKEQGKGRYVIFTDKIFFRDTTKPCILVVDDDEPSRAIITSNFKNDYNIIEAESGNVALEMLSAYYSRITICLLDIEMPEMSGF